MVKEAVIISHPALFSHLIPAKSRYCTFLHLICTEPTIQVNKINLPTLVGYSGAQLRLRAKIAGAAFVPVSGAKTMDLTEIRVSGYDPFDPVTEDGGSWGDVVVQTLNENGKDTATYYFFDFQEEGVTYFGWYNNGEYDKPLAKGEVVLASGEGIWTYCSDFGYDYQLQSAGQVLTDKDQPTLLRLRAKMVANVTPVDVDLTDCYVSGYDPFDPVTEEGGSWGDVVVQILNENGKDTATYYFFDFQEEGVTYLGWYKNGEYDQPLAKGEVVTGAGQGLWTYCSDFGYDYCFVWPKVDVK